MYGARLIPQKIIESPKQQFLYYEDFIDLNSIDVLILKKEININELHKLSIGDYYRLVAINLIDLHNSRIDTSKNFKTVQ